jgi:fumarate reductase subunit C
VQSRFQHQSIDFLSWVDFHLVPTMTDSNTTTVQSIFRHCKDLVDVYPDLCSYDDSFYDYRILLAPNAVFLGFFGASALGYFVVFAVTRFKNVGFNVALILGVICELLGYLGRVMSWQDQWAENPFMMQISCLTIAPAFLAAGVYFCLRSIVMAFGAENSRISPALYPRIVSLRRMWLTGDILMD